MLGTYLHQRRLHPDLSHLRRNAVVMRKVRPHRASASALSSCRKPSASLLVTLRRIDSAGQTFGELVALEWFGVHAADISGSTAIMPREKPRNGAVRARVRRRCRVHVRCVDTAGWFRPDLAGDMPWVYAAPLRLELAEDGLLRGKAGSATGWLLREARALLSRSCRYCLGPGSHAVHPCPGK